ncbi:MAG: glycosyltransferase, partial [Oryzihumus sp.]
MPVPEPTSAPELTPAPEPTPAPATSLPAVSVVMPILNEERHLEEAVAAVLGQDYAGPVEVVLALGPSRDRTDEIAAALAAADP